MASQPNISSSSSLILSASWMSSSVDFCLSCSRKLSGFSSLFEAMIALFRIIVPEPAHGVGEEGCTVLDGVTTLTEDKLIIVFYEGKGGGHGVIRLRPV